VLDTYGSGVAVLGLLAIILGGLAVVLGVPIFRRRRPARPVPLLKAAPDPVSGSEAANIESLEHQARRRLVEADNALRTTEENLAIAAKATGEEATESDREATRRARTELTEAFRLRQQLDEAYPPDEPVQRAKLAEIVDRCARTEQLLAPGTGAAPDLAGLAVWRDQIRAQLPRAADTLNHLQSRYAASAFATIGDATELATARLDGVRALHRASVLLAAITRLGTDLQTATICVRILLPWAQARIEAGKSVQQAAAAVARAEQVAIDVRTGLVFGCPDPIGSLARLVAASATLDAALGGSPDGPRILLDYALFSARTAVDSTDRFIDRRRDRIGCGARTRQCEARRHLDEAAGATDPVAALTAAVRATSRAQQALDAARADLDAVAVG